MFNKKILTMAMAVLTCTTLLAGCGSSSSDQQKDQAAQENFKGKITAAGSTALLPLLKPAQEIFQKKYPDLTVNVSGGGSFTGMSQVAAGNVDIGDSDVDLPKEYQDKGLVDHKVVVEPFVFIVNKDVNVDNLSKQQVVDILTGKITNWKQVGGKDEAITLIHRAKSSGSRATISKVVLEGKPFTDKAVIQDSNGALRKAVSTTPGSIGYVDAPYADDSVKVLSFDGVKYSPENVIAGKYPVYGYGHMYTKGEPTGAVKAYIDYIMSDEFQNSQVAKLGFVPVAKMPKQ